MNKANMKIILSLMVCFCIIFIMAFSEGFIVTHTNHICSGDDCQICESIHIYQDVLNTIGTAAIFIALMSFLILQNESNILSGSAVKKEFETLHSLKVRLNN